MELIEDELKKIFDSEEIAITGKLVIHPDGHKEFVPDEKDVDLDGKRISIREVIRKEPEPEESGIWAEKYGAVPWRIVTTDHIDNSDEELTWTYGSGTTSTTGSFVWNTSDTVTTTDCSMVYAKTDGTIVYGDIAYEENS